MKKCPKCHKNIPSNAKVCPYCGTPQSGYQPMKRTPNRKYAFIYPILIIALVFLRNYLPGYMNSEIRAQVVENALRVDKLHHIIKKKNIYKIKSRNSCISI